MTKRNLIPERKVIDLATILRIKKKNKLRYNEYYSLQKAFDELYENSRNNVEFINLYDFITSRENILLAYRNIKRNSGSKTSGENYHTIDNLANLKEEELVKYIQKRFENFKPLPVRRTFIPKANGKLRPLGIPDIEDRIIQQCIKQVLEPICEAKFFDKSYGFRSNRSTENAIAYVYKKINRDKCYYFVDVDIKGFFDNVDHGKLLKQIWNLNIHDKKLIKIISKMLKMEIIGEGICKKGIPQGGIISPLLANIVLNELDWWICSQWEEIKTKHDYQTSRGKEEGYQENSHKYRALRKNSKLKEMYLVRYADDFKIMCKDKETAKRVFIAVEKWLKERLNLEISKEKSKITNVKVNYTEFLGFKIKAKKKNKKYVVSSRVSEKAKKDILEKLKEQIQRIKENANTKEVNKFNSMVLGIQNYYSIATLISLDFSIIYYILRQVIEIRLRHCLQEKGFKSKLYKEKYKSYNAKEYYILDTIMFPLGCIKTRNPMNFKRGICNYTTEGRELIHKNLDSRINGMLKYILENPVEQRSVEFNDNRLSKYSGQKGICAISGKELEYNFETHHIKPISQGGNDNYDNLLLINKNIHKLIHAVNDETIRKYLKEQNLDKKCIEKLNKYRKKVGNNAIKYD